MKNSKSSEITFSIGITDWVASLLMLAVIALNVLSPEPMAWWVWWAFALWLTSMLGLCLLGIVGILAACKFRSLLTQKAKLAVADLRAGKAVDMSLFKKQPKPQPPLVKTMACVPSIVFDAISMALLAVFAQGFIPLIVAAGVARLFVVFVITPYARRNQRDMISAITEARHAAGLTIIDIETQVIS